MRWSDTWPTDEYGNRTASFACMSPRRVSIVASASNDRVWLADTIALTPLQARELGAALIRAASLTMR